jgi:glycosyltransferase involved in cell wall biosynthesis
MKISVIMPTLDSAKHINTSLESLAAQSFKDFEIIVADSGSTDGTMDIIEAHNRKTHNVRIVPAPGLSPALARNAGIDAALGEYVAFCDSDDFMKPDMLEALSEAAAAGNADIVACDFDMIYPSKTIRGFARMEDGRFELSGKGLADYYYRFCAAPKPNNYVWSRLYRRGFLVYNDIRFPSTRYSEDHLFNLGALLKAPQIVHIGRPLYRYMQYDDSAMRKHMRRGKPGQLFLECFRKARETMAAAGRGEAETEPILAIYAYTRIKSIMFYAWQAQIPDAEILDAVSAFASDSEAGRHLALCAERDYIGQYCRLHGFSVDWENTVRTMLRACAGGSALPDMREVFA